MYIGVIEVKFTRKDENMFLLFERRILRRIYGSVKDNGIWRLRYNHELHKLLSCIYVTIDGVRIGYWIY
jgi:hypothetical protein